MNDRTADNLNDRTPAVAHDEHRTKGAALLIIDMIGTFEHEDGDKLFENAKPAAQKIGALKKRAAELKIPVIFVNDNYGEWRNDFHATLEAARASELGAQILDLIDVGPEDYHVLKPQRSGFFSTPLEVLLASLKVSTVIITGISTDICVLFTANDAYMRGYHVIVPRDSTAAVTAEQASSTLELLERVSDADTTPSDRLDLEKVQTR
jgi:nicotinamidase-related amidase